MKRERKTASKCVDELLEGKTLKTIFEEASEEEPMTKAEVLDVLTKAKGSTNEWAVRDKILTLAKKYMETDLVSVDVGAAEELFDELIAKVKEANLEQDVLWDIYDTLASVAFN